MKIEIVDRDFYKEIQKRAKIAFDEVWFHDINGSKVEKLYYLLFKTGKYKAGLIAGVSDHIVNVPYSAPFAMFEYFRYCRIEEQDEMLKALDDFAKERGVRKINFKLPPLFYNEAYISKLTNSLLRSGYKIDSVDLNYQIIINDMEYYMGSLHRNAKKSLKHAKSYDYRLVNCETVAEKKRAYDIIKLNRSSKGYYLSMSWELVNETLNYINHDIFILKLGRIEVASAIVFQVADRINQVIYWGDIPGYSDKRPMNMLSYKVVKYYQGKGVDILDIGPSTVNGIPNEGLCDFKESIGCSVSSKFGLCKEVK